MKNGESVEEEYVQYCFFNNISHKKMANGESYGDVVAIHEDLQNTCEIYLSHIKLNFFSIFLLIIIYSI